MKKKIVCFYQKEQEEPAILEDYVKAGYDSKQMARMTHVECFTLPVWDVQSVRLAGRRQDFGAAVQTDSRCWCLLFDYQNRNPLNKEARTVLLDI